MNKICAVFTTWLSLMLVGNYALSETSDTMDAEALLKLAPRISLEEKSISTFDVKGTLDFNGVQLRFVVSGKQPDQIALRILDPLDKTPIMVGVGDSFMLYDPISSEVLVGRATSTFTLSVEKDPENASETNPNPQKGAMGFEIHSIKEKKESEEEKPKITVIDIRSFLDSLITPLEVKTEDNKRFVLSGLTKKGNKAKVYVTPSRKEGPYTKMELYQSGKDKPFLVLDEIVLNQPLPATRFTFQKKKLLSSALSTKQMSDDGQINTVLSTGRLFRAIMTRLVLAGVDDSEIRSTVEKMSMRKLNWDKLKKDDKMASIILRSIFQDDVIQPTMGEEKTIQQENSPDKK